MQKKVLIPTLSVIGLILIFFVAQGITGFSVNSLRTTYEITETDILSLNKIVHAKQITVKGVVLGDTLETVIEKIGYPDSQTLYPPSIINIEYGKKFDLEETGLILHLVSNKVTKITLKEPFNEFLKGKTKVAHTKTSIFNLLGTPDGVKKIPVKKDSALVMSVYSYERRGIEVVIRKQQQNALVLTL